MERASRDERPTVEEMLERIRREGGAGARGRHRIYLGMAPGVGKTYAALLELHQLASEGVDVAIGYVETYGRPRTAALVQGLEVVPRKRCAYKGVIVEEMDLDAVLARRPTIVLVDELAHTNVPGCTRHEKRWQDVLELQEHGITVFSTLNVQHIESLADIVEAITGVQVRERVPDWVVDQADEVILVDLTPGELRERLRRGRCTRGSAPSWHSSGSFAKETLRRSANSRSVELRPMSKRISSHTCGSIESKLCGPPVSASWSRSTHTGDRSTSYVADGDVHRVHSPDSSPSS